MGSAHKHGEKEMVQAASWGALAGLIALALLAGYFAFNTHAVGATVSFVRDAARGATSTPATPSGCAPIDATAYDTKMTQLANYPAPKVASSTSATSTAPSTPIKAKPWPAANAPRPVPCAILPFHRIVAYYGNFYSKGMGVLGQYPEDEMLAKLQAEVAKWNAADPSTPVIPAIHYIVETAQADKSKSGYYIARMPDSQIDEALELAKKINGIVFIDFQVGTSDVQRELPMYETYLEMPNVHVGIDPEFSMKDGVAPGREIGTMDASDINWVAQYLQKIVQQHNLPPKILVVHRFTEDMLTNYRAIRPLPEVQMVIDMDGWGFPAKKINTYNSVVASEPVQFTGFKLFYKNDLLPPSTALLTPAQILNLIPQPIYIQYQ